MAKFKVLLTDYAWPDVEVERSVLAEIDAELVVAKTQDVDQLAALATDVDAILTCWAQVPAAVITAAPRCRIVSRLGIGLDNIDVDCCTRQGIPVTNVPDYCVTEVAEHTMALTLALARRIALFHHATKSGRYDRDVGPTPRRIEGQTFGVVGPGNIGGRVALKARALGMNVLATRRSNRQPAGDMQTVPLDELLARSDFVSLHVPLTDLTRGMLGDEQLSRMKPTAYLINTSRGGLIDHDALARALQRERLAGAALDVQDPEPPDLSQPPYNDPRVIVTPHAAFVSVESVGELRRRAAGQIATRLGGGHPDNVVNPQVLD